MNEKFYIIHGFAGHPKMHWFPWLKRELEQMGHFAEVPKMPKPLDPKIKEWVSFLSSTIQKPDKNTYLIGHSIGCQTILRYLEQLPEGTKIGGVLLVAPFLELDDKVKKIIKPWVETPIDFSKIKKHTNKIICIFSDDDPLIPISNKKLFEKKLGSKTVVLHEYDHFVTFRELPEILPELMTLLE
jgi:predicted alpha/beta hydrolase family esterase